MSPSNPPLRSALAAPGGGASKAAGFVGQQKSDSFCDSFHRSVADEDFSAACLGLQPRTQRAVSPTPPNAPVETPTSIRMRRTIKRLLPRVCSVPLAPEADSRHHEVPRMVAWSQPETDGLAEKFKIRVHAKGMWHFTDEEECRHDALWRDESDKVCSAAGTPRRRGCKSSKGASVETAAEARAIFVDEAALFSNSDSKMKTAWPSFVSAPLPLTHIKPSRHVSRLLLSSLLQQIPVPPPPTVEPATSPSLPDDRTCTAAAADTPAMSHRSAAALAVAAAFEAQGAAFGPAALPKCTQKPPLRPFAPIANGRSRRTVSPASSLLLWVPM